MGRIKKKSKAARNRRKPAAAVPTPVPASAPAAAAPRKTRKTAASAPSPTSPARRNTRKAAAPDTAASASASSTRSSTVRLALVPCVCRGVQLTYAIVFHARVVIERVWGAAKAKARRLCGYSIHELRKNVPKALASVGIGTIRRFFRKVLRFHSIYRLTANGALADFIATKYKSHRRVGVNDLKTLLDELDAITDRTDLQDRYRAEIRAIVEAARRDGPTPA